MSESEIIARGGTWSFELWHDREVSSLGARAISKGQPFLSVKANECALKHRWGVLLLTMRYNFPKLKQEKNAAIGPRSPQGSSSAGLSRVTRVCISQDTCSASDSLCVYHSAINFVRSGQLALLWIGAAQMELHSLASLLPTSFLPDVKTAIPHILLSEAFLPSFFSLWNNELIT